ncbi:MAG: protein translocase subunit SecF [Candidatus Jorgensenbacteria bacterium]
MRFDLIKHKYWFLGFSGVLILISLVAVAVFGLRAGIDLKGGAQWEVSFSGAAPTEDAVRVALQGAGAREVFVKREGEGALLIRLPVIDEPTHAAYAEALKMLGVLEEKNFSSIGPTIGAELRTRAIWAIVLVLLGISLYVAWAFRKVAAPVASWKYGLVTLFSLFHDVAIPVGLLAVLGWWQGIEIDTNFIVALLVVMGFSVHDTIVVFDRIRENLLLAKGKRFSFGDLINQSVGETFARSVNTSLTLIIVLVALLVVGPPSLFYFVLTILVGTVFGTYSSIFIASPLLYLFGRRAAP